LDQFQAYAWPGNIRELQNVIERSLILCETKSFSIDKSWRARESPEPEMATSLPAQKRITDEKALIEAALTETRGRVSAQSGASIKLRLPAPTLESKIRSMKINKYVFKAI
jgi:DNA-binding NtrC family response regulator